MFFNYATKFLVINKKYFFLAETQRNAKKNLVPVPKSRSQTKRRINDILFIFHCVVWYVSTIMNYALWIMNCFMAFRLSPSGFPLYLCSLHSRLASQNQTSALRQAQWPRSRPRTSFPISLAKDAAPIPNALAAIKTRKIPEFQKSVKSHESVETPREWRLYNSQLPTPNSQLLTPNS